MVEIDNGVPGDHIGELRCDILRGSSLEVISFLVVLEVMRWAVGGWLLECGWEGFGHAMCCGPVEVGGGVLVWEGSAGVDVGLVMSCCVWGADADFVLGSPLMMSIVVGSVSVWGSRGQ